MLDGYLDFGATIGKFSIPMVRVKGMPGPGEYLFDGELGEYIFHPDDRDSEITVLYSLEKTFWERESSVKPAGTDSLRVEEN